MAVPLAEEMAASRAEKLGVFVRTLGLPGLDDAVLEACDLQGAGLAGVRARRTRFRRSNLDTMRLTPRSRLRLAKGAL